VGNAALRDAEIGIVAKDRERYQTGRDYRGKHEHARALFERPTHLLNAEDDPGKGRVKGGGDAGRGAGEKQTRLAMRLEAAQQEHCRGPDLHGWSLAAARGAAQQAEHQQRDLGRSEPRRHQPGAILGPLQLAGGHDLRNATPLGALEVPPCKVGREGEPCRRNHEGRPRPPRIGLSEGPLRSVRSATRSC
jgi:hypothetical protein